MSVLQAIILGLVQGITEFLPISSSGHLEVAEALLGLDIKESLAFTVFVHGATVLSILTVYYQDLWRLARGSIARPWNAEQRYISKLLVSMIPVAMVGLLFEQQIAACFAGRLDLVGIAFCVTGAILLASHLAPGANKEISYAMALAIGLAQMIAVLPGISRSGATISMALVMGAGRDKATRFSFLMVLAPIVGANGMKMLDASWCADIALWPLLAGFLAAYVSGYLACRWMVRLVKRGMLFWFAFYLFALGVVTVCV